MMILVTIIMSYIIIGAFTGRGVVRAQNSLGRGERLRYFDETDWIPFVLCWIFWPIALPCLGVYHAFHAVGELMNGDNPFERFINADLSPKRKQIEEKR